MRRSLLVAVAAGLVATMLSPGTAAEGRGDPEDIAISHVRSHAKELGVTPSDVSELTVVPRSTPSHRVVTSVTPVANAPMTCRSSHGSRSAAAVVRASLSIRDVTGNSVDVA